MKPSHCVVEAPLKLTAFFPSYLSARIIVTAPCSICSLHICFVGQKEVIYELLLNTENIL